MKDLRLDREGLSSIFSELESDILNIAWTKGDVTSKALHNVLGGKHGVAHSTVAVTLNRLYEKNILSRRPESGRGGTRFIYNPAYSKKELGDHIAGKFLVFLRKNFGESCVANLKKNLDVK